MKIFLCLFLPFYCLAQPYTDYIGAGHSKGIIVSSSSSLQNQSQAETASGERTLTGQGLEGRISEASRFLSQCTFGSNKADVDLILENGKEAWFEEQANLPLHDYYKGAEAYAEYFNNYYLSQGADSSELSFYPGWAQWRYEFWNRTVNGNDQLRNRMAFALSQILVVSDEAIGNADALAGYYNLLGKHAFGNYRDLLYEVALNPTMGYYLSHLNNPREIPEENIHPDQNFAREIMQLFSIGLFELNNDGSRKLDTEGKPIPTYNNNQIAELAKVFTGLSIGEVYPGMGDLYFGRGIYGANMRVPMVMFDEWHEKSEKRLLNNLVLPSGQDGLRDISDAIDMLINHPSCPPFISKQLIQRFVKSNPSPSYIRRVSEAFINDGNGVRGNLKAVLKAILFDPEARECSFIQDPTSGKLSEPILRKSRMMKHLGIIPETDIYADHAYSYSARLLQGPLASPSVFNFYSPDHAPNGQLADMSLVAPEFQIVNSLSIIEYPNFIRYGVFYEGINENWEDGPFRTYLNLPSLLRYSYDNEVLINKLDLGLTHGNMSIFTRELIKDAIKDLPPTLSGLTDKIRLALYLTLISPDFVVEK